MIIFKKIFFIHLLKINLTSNANLEYSEPSVDIEIDFNFNYSAKLAIVTFAFDSMF